MKQDKYKGLSEQDVIERQEKGLVNISNDSIFKSTKEIILTHTVTYFNILNLFLGCLILVSGQYKNITFMGVIIINSIIGIVQELKVKKLVEKLSVITVQKANVIRGGKKQEINIQEVVLEDVVVLENGDQICADGIVLESEGMEVNESMLTGESKPVRKKQGDSLFSGSFLVAGSGVERVLHVGDENYASELSVKAKTKKRAASEMQRTIKRIIKVLGVLILPIGLLLYRSQMSVKGAEFSDSLVATVAGVIGMIPEGLVLLTSISFILGVGRLAKKKALVQEMEAIEALARVNVLCLDKTGTITTGELEVTEIIPLNDESESHIEEIMNEMAFAFDDINNTQKALMKRFKEVKKWTISEKIPFSSERKYRALSFEKEGCYVLGAAELLNGQDKELLQKADMYASEGLRVLLLGKCEAICAETSQVFHVTPLGFILISDCIRTDAADTFQYFREQNVEIKVVSGDSPKTVSKIAVKAGLENGERYIDAKELPEDNEQLRKVIDQYAVFGRVTPEQKQRIICAYQNNKKVVGMVGDGVNDVLALKDADCGIAMAAGSDAAKQVAHIVLTDSNFACLKNIVSEGRTIITNIERVSSLYLTKTIYSVLLCVIFIFLQRPYPFIPIQLSWISSTAIGIPSFILALEQTESVNSGGFLRHILKIALPSGVTMVLCMLLLQGISGFWNFDETMTYTFNTLVGGTAAMMVVVKVCSPMNWLRRTLSVSVSTIFAFGIMAAPGLLGIYSVFRWEMLLFIPLLCMVIVFYQISTGFADLCFRIKEWIREKIKRKTKKKN